jgi:hypothetical protein
MTILVPDFDMMSTDPSKALGSLMCSLFSFRRAEAKFQLQTFQLMISLNCISTLHALIYTDIHVFLNFFFGLISDSTKATTFRSFDVRRIFPHSSEQK